MAVTYEPNVEAIGGAGGLGGFGQNPLLWLITLGFLKGNDGLFGGNNNGAGAGVLAGETQAKLDCLQQQHATIQAQIANNAQLQQFDRLSAEISVLAGVGRDNQAAITQQINDTRQQIADCCCETNRNIDDVKTQMAQQTSTLVASGLANTQRILDKLCDNELAVKEAEIRRLQDALQTQTIVNNCNGSHHNNGGNNIDINVLAAALAANGNAATRSVAK